MDKFKLGEQIKYKNNIIKIIGILKQFDCHLDDIIFCGGKDPFLSFNNYGHLLGSSYFIANVDYNYQKNNAFLIKNLSYYLYWVAIYSKDLNVIGKKL